MANATTYELSGRIGGAGILAQLRKAIADRRRFWATLDELRALSDRELRDLGISRYSIREIAYESVYGA